MATMAALGSAQAARSTGQAAPRLSARLAAARRLAATPVAPRSSRGPAAPRAAAPSDAPAAEKPAAAPKKMMTLNEAQTQATALEEALLKTLDEQKAKLSSLSQPGQRPPAPAELAALLKTFEETREKMADTFAAVRAEADTLRALERDAKAEAARAVDERKKLAQLEELAATTDAGVLQNKLKAAMDATALAEKALAGTKMKIDRLKEQIGKGKKKERAKKTDEDFTQLTSLASRVIISPRGLIEPVVTPGAKATVYAILDDFKRVMFVGWSYDYKNELRRLVIRQPKIAIHYMSADVVGNDIDDSHMEAHVKAWYDELGGPPVGNKTPETIAAWKDPFEAGEDAIAAEERITSVMTYLQTSRGLKEDFRFDPNLIANGMVMPMDSEVGSHLSRYTARFRLVPPEVRALSGQQTVGEMPQLKDMASRRIVTKEGKVDPVVLPCTQYTCFAVLDFVQKVQFVGFSRDLKNTLRKIVARQPEKAYFYMSVDIAASTPEHLAHVQNAWLTEMDGVPFGNRPENEAEWVSAIDCGSPAAAKAKGEAHLAQLQKQRGLSEKFEFDPKLMAEGKLDLLPVADAASVLVTAVDADDDMDYIYLCTRNKAVKGAVMPDEADVAARSGAVAKWVDGWRKKTGGESTYEYNPKPILATLKLAKAAADACPLPLPGENTMMMGKKTVQVIEYDMPAPTPLPNAPPPAAAPAPELMPLIATVSVQAEAPAAPPASVEAPADNSVSWI